MGAGVFRGTDTGVKIAKSFFASKYEAGKMFRLRVIAYAAT
jgi:hypothetical protein